MNNDYGIVYKCAVQGRTAFLLRHIYYNASVFIGVHHKAHKTKYLLTNIRLLKRFLFIEQYSKNSYCGGLLQGQMQRKANMTNKQKETLARNIMLVLLLMLVAMTISTLIWGYWL